MTGTDATDKPKMATNDTITKPVTPQTSDTSTALMRLGAFCPLGGLLGDSSLDFDEKSRCLLRSRLRTASLILLGAFAVFLVRNLFGGGPDFMTQPVVLIPHIAVTLLLGLVSMMLCARCSITLMRLRLMETLTFGGPVAVFIWIQYCRVCNTPADDLAAAGAFAAETAIPWILLIQLYGLFIPNKSRRASVVIGSMAILPICGATAAWQRHAAVAAELADGGFSSLVLWIGIAAVTAVYGSNRFGKLRREAFEAHRLGAYTLKEKLGAGGMGEVYRAEHRLLKRPCAIKLIRPAKSDDAQAIARFESEVQATAKLTHPNTIEIYDYGQTEEGTFYYVMELLPGLNLQELVDRYGPLDPARTVHLLAQLCSALTEAHSCGLIHRDIKPSNIFAAERGGVYDVAKLLDFGLVKSTKPDIDSIKLTIDGAVVGSPLYAAPEMTVENRPDERSDIYSLAATAYFMLTGQPLFSGDNPLKVIFAHVNQTPPLPSELGVDLPEQLESIVMRCLKKDPGDRFADVRSLAEALERCRFEPKWTAQRAARWWAETVSNQPRVVSDAVGLDKTVALHTE